MRNPTSWDDVHNCRCSSCQVLAEIHDLCVARREQLFVIDCRMFGRGFRVADRDAIFVRPATDAEDFATSAKAAQFVLRRQAHCEVFLSTFPARPIGHADFGWSRESHRLATVLQPTQ